MDANSSGKVGKGPGPYIPEMSWDSWIERFDFFIKLRKIADEETKKLLFFTEIGAVYDERQPDDVRTMALKDIKALMAERYGETKSLAAKRHELFSAKQGTQSIRDFSIELRSLIAKAEWGRTSIDMCLCALFINGIRSDPIRAELIKKGDNDLKFKDAVEMAVLLEQSEVDAVPLGLMEHHNRKWPRLWHHEHEAGSLRGSATAVVSQTIGPRTARIDLKSVANVGISVMVRKYAEVMEMENRQFIIS